MQVKKWAVAAALVLLSAIGACGQTPDGFQPQKLYLSHTISTPLGFARGMTKEQVTAVVGKENVAEVDPNDLGGVTMYLRTAPKPFSAFSDYVVEISPTQGLLNVEAFGKPIDTSEDGTELRHEFSAVEEQLLSIYGLPVSHQDSLKPGSPYQEEHYFTLGLLRKDRMLVTMWGMTSQPVNASLSTIMLKANAKDLTTGFLTLSYYFVGWDEYYQQLKSKEGSVL